MVNIGDDVAFLTITSAVVWAKRVQARRRFIAAKMEQLLEALSTVEGNATLELGSEEQ